VNRLVNRHSPWKGLSRFSVRSAVVLERIQQGFLMPKKMCKKSIKGHGDYYRNGLRLNSEMNWLLMHKRCAMKSAEPGGGDGLVPCRPGLGRCKK